MAIFEIIFDLHIITDVLTTTDLSIVQNTTWDACCKWYNIGLGLGIPVDSLDTINLNNQGNCERCYTKMLTEWLRRASPRPTWSVFAEALRSPSVRMGHIAEQLPSDQCECLLPQEAILELLTPLMLILIQPKVCSRRTKQWRTQPGHDLF